MNLINLTPHDVKIVRGDDSTTIPASGVIPRVAMEKEGVEQIDLDGLIVPVNRVTLGEIEGLPAPRWIAEDPFYGPTEVRRRQDGGNASCGVHDDAPVGKPTGAWVESEGGAHHAEPVLFIVSRVVAEAAKDRDDLLIPDDVARDEEGRVIGCRALARI